MQKRTRKDLGFNLDDESEEVVASGWNSLILDEVQRVFHNWMSRLADPSRMADIRLLNKRDIIPSYFLNVKIGGFFLTACI
jgi:hypothetical protein